MHKLSIQPAAALCAPLVHLRPTTYLPHIREIPTNMHPAGPEIAIYITFVRHVKWKHAKCGGAGGTQSVALGCTSTIITIRWRIHVMKEMEACDETYGSARNLTDM